MTWDEYTLFIYLDRQWHWVCRDFDENKVLNNQQWFEYEVGVPAKITTHYIARPQR